MVFPHPIVVNLNIKKLLVFNSGQTSLFSTTFVSAYVHHWMRFMVRGMNNLLHIVSRYIIDLDISLSPSSQDILLSSIATLPYVFSIIYFGHRHSCSHKYKHMIYIHWTYIINPKWLIHTIVKWHYYNINTK